MDFSEIDLSSLPVWLIAIAIILYLSPRILQGLGVFIPPLGEWIETRQAVVHHRLNSQAAEQAHDVLIDMRLFNLLEQSLQQSWVAQEKLNERMAELARAIERNNGLLTTLNISISQLTDRVTGKDD